MGDAAGGAGESTTAKAGAMSVWQAQLMSPTQLFTLGTTLYCTVKVALGMLSKHIETYQSDSKNGDDDTVVEINDSKAVEMELAMLGNWELPASEPFFDTLTTY